MSKKIAIVITILLVVVGFMAVRFLAGDEDNWVCQDGLWVKHGNPKEPMPTILCGQNNSQEKIKVFYPKPNETVLGSFEITGEARGNWFFEASFPIKLLDENGNELAVAIATAQGDWMTENLVPFKAQMEYLTATDTKATLLLIKDNPSGLPENDDKVEIPIIIKGQETTKVKLYFGKTGEGEDCNKVFAVERNIPKTKTPAGDTIKALLLGLTEKERLDGYITSINSGVSVNSLSINNGTAKIDFDEKIEEGVGGSCKVAAIRAQITETLKQFFSVTTVVISVNGRTEDILQP